MEFLPILDSFALACEHAKQENGEDAKLLEGFKLIQKQFETALEKLNVVSIESVGTAFDPNLHQAISQEKQDGTDSGIVLKELQKGYTLHDRVIRASLVIVSE